MNRTIYANKLIKAYGDFRAVNDVSFAIESGEVFGFLGPNGAGKSTIIKMLTTLAVPSSGTATVGGFDTVSQAADVRRIAGVALQEIGIDPLMKSAELLILQARLFGFNQKQAKRRADDLISIVRLTEFTNRPVGKYSGGMRRRLDLALALVHQPSVLFLDEPTTGLDPASRRDIWQEVQRLNREQGITIFLTTQYLEEADALGDRIAIIDAGQLVAAGKPDELKSALGSDAVNVAFADVDSAESALNTLQPFAERTTLDGTTVRLYLQDAAAAVPSLVNRLNDVALKPTALTLSQPTLDDVFLQVTGQRYQASATQSLATQP